MHPPSPGRVREEHTLSVRGLRRDYGVDRGRFRETLLAVLSGENAPGGSVSVSFVSASVMRRTNHEYRGVDSETDVLSFSYLDEPFNHGVLGEIHVCEAVTRRQAAENHCATDEEIARVAVHGLLHVLGYEHDTPESRRKMLRRQEKYLKRYLSRSASC
ncbi:MAG: rRNA maturation RNase YbeY [Gemmatimonadota bacterium]|nr:rRNA maturation RNase YbeY [Gemmatimonadota bacterium]